MGAYLARHLLSASITLFTIAILSFLLIHLTPGDPIAFALGEQASAEQITQIREGLGLNDPLPQQFVRWLGRILLKFDLGTSLQTNQPVLTLLTSRVEPTLLFAAFSFLIAALVGLPSGILAAVRHARIADQVTMGFATLGMSIPTFMFGIGLILAFAVRFEWFPVAGYVPLREGVLGTFRHIFLPSLALGLTEAAFIARITRTSLLEVLGEDYIRTARSKGLKEARIIRRHALLTASIPIITVIGLTIARLLGGSVVLEEVFSLPGIGQMAITAIRRRDYPVIQAVVLLSGLIYMLVNLIVDVAYAYVDPRIRYD